MKQKAINTRLLLEAIHDRSSVTGFTHNFYNYPARFSPIFVREAIKAFTKPNDLVIDPFVGGGTTLVEARLLNRNSIGLDISSLASFITKTKITLLNKKEIKVVQNYSDVIVENLDCYFSSKKISSWKEEGYHRNVSDKSTWRIRNLIDHFLEQIANSKLLEKQKNFLRCSILKTGQWALDNKKTIPSIKEFKKKLSNNIVFMAKGAEEFNESVCNNPQDIVSLCYNKPSYKIKEIKILKKLPAPTLILTSPPYPGVHIVYHRWQVQGRKETPAPFWIANSLDGHGLSHYAMGGRKEIGLETYFANILKSYSSIRKICSKETLIVQMLAFSDISWQLPQYLEIMEQAGFKEVQITNDRIWRDVPNRKWYAGFNNEIQSNSEVVLFHKVTT